jgi:hypothetical protein
VSDVFKKYEVYNEITESRFKSMLHLYCPSSSKVFPETPVDVGIEAGIVAETVAILVEELVEELVVVALPTNS